MIQLYKKGNHEYSMNGDQVLQAEECTLNRILNGAWELYLEVPLDKEGKFKDIINEAIIKAPAPEGDRLFAIYDTNKISDDVLSASARPIFFNAAHDAFLLDVRPTGKNGQEALDIMTAGTPYSGKSDITSVNTAYYVRKNLLEAINSDDEQSFLNRWGGEVLYNDFEIVVNKRVGGDYGVQILYGKNLEAIQEHCNTEDVVTRIIPMAYNGYMLEGDAPWVDSPLINSYENIRYRVIKYEDVKLTEDCSGDEAGFDTLEDLRAELIRRCNLEYASGIDKPTVTLDVSMVDLSQAVEYKDYKILETVSLGDSVYCKHAGLGIETEARVIQQKWDCIRKRNADLIIGDFQYNYFNKLSSSMKSVEKVIRSDGTLMGERISGFIDGAMAMLKSQYDVAKKQDVIAILFENLDEESDLYGALALGTQGLMISKTRTEDGRGWAWTTAVTAKGAVADTVVVGVLSDKAGKNYWDMEKGDFRLASASLKIDNATLRQYVQESAGNPESLTPERVFDLLTNNGEIKGIYMEDGQLYINLTYCKAGSMVIGGTENERGSITLRDENDEVAGHINNSGASFRLLEIGDRIIITDINKMYQVSIGFDQDTGNFYISGDELAVILNNIIAKKITSGETDAGNLTALTAQIVGTLNVEGDTTGLNGTLSYKKISSAESTTNIFKAQSGEGTETRIESEKIYINTYNGAFRPVGAYGAAGRRVGHLSTRGADGVYRLAVNAQWDDAGTEDTVFATKFITTNDSTSDIRLKENIKECDIYALDLIQRIKIHQFDWKESKNHQKIGMIADELELLDPRLSYGGGTEDDGSINPKTINSFYLMGYIVKAIQELDARLTEVEKKEAGYERTDFAD